MNGGTTIAEAARAVLMASAPLEKIRVARRAARSWRRGALDHGFNVAMPTEPIRPASPELLPPSRMPRRGRAGSLRGRTALLHALAHIEFSAIDLAFDLIGRFGAAFPREFVDDWVGVGADEAMHFAMLDRRLRALGSFYGELPAHAGLWEAAAATSDDVLARLAVVPMVLEARGLDVSPMTIERLTAAGDERSAAILRRIYEDEVRHVGAGVKWFRIASESRGFEPISRWKWLIKNYHKGELKPPFNDSARDRAGLSREYYRGLADQQDV